MSINAAALADIDKRQIANLTAELHVADSDTLTPATRWQSQGGLSVTYNPNATNNTRHVPIRGLKRPISSFTEMIDPSYDISGQQLTDDMIDWIFYVDAGHAFGSEGGDNAQSAISATAGTAWDFDEGADGTGIQIGQRVDVLDAAGNHVTFDDDSALTLAGTQSNYGSAGSATALLEGTDFEFDRELGQVVFLRAINDDVITPTLTSPAITSASKNYMTKRMPIREGKVSLRCRLFFFDQDKDSNLILAHKDFLGEISASGGLTADGSAEANPGVNIKILDEGRLFKRQN